MTKRFTSLSHFFLGLALSVAPVGAWMAVRGEHLQRILAGGAQFTMFEVAPYVLAVAVLLWVAGFDMIYATQDHEFDRAEGLRSLVVALGVSRRFRLAQVLHWLMLGLLAVFGWCAALLDVAAIDRAFFASNAFVGLVFVAAIAIEVAVQP